MFDRLEDLVRRLEELNIELTDPDTISNQEKYRQLMKEQNELTPIVEKYLEYKKAKEGVQAGSGRLRAGIKDTDASKGSER